MSSFATFSDLSRTQVSTVTGFSLSQAQTQSVSYSLGTLLRMVQQLSVSRCLPHELSFSKHVAEGETYSVARAELRGRTVAVKYLKLQVAEHGLARLSLERRIQAVLKEVCVMRHDWLAGHPNIVKILGYGWTQARRVPNPFLIVEYGAVGSLRSWLQGDFDKLMTRTTGRTRSELGGGHFRLYAALCRQVASGMIALHQCGIIHGDLKLDNIIVCGAEKGIADIQVKLSDFGHSIVLDATKQDQVYYGTTLYNAPEVLLQDIESLKDDQLQKCDVWAFGLLVWEVFLNGRTWFDTAWQNDPKFQLPQSSIGTSSIGNPFDKGVASGWSTFSGRYHELYGNFDLRHVQQLALSFISRIEDTYGHLREARIAQVLLKALAADSKDRASDILALGLEGVRVLKDPPEYVSIVRPENLKLSVGMFRSVSSFDFRWDFQEEVFKDIESLADSDVTSQHSAAAAFQAGLCYLRGFGCEVDLDQAASWFSMAKDRGHPLAPHMIAQLTRGELFQERYFRYLVAACAAGDLYLDDDIEDPVPINDAPLAALTSGTSLTTFSIVSTGSAIAFEQDRGSVLDQMLEEGDDVDRIGSDGLTQLTRACREGDHATVVGLLQKGARIEVCDKTGCNVFHWIFCLSDHLDVLSPLVLERVRCGGPSSIAAIMSECRKSFKHHRQWPFALTGAPIAFAIMSGSRRTVQFLLECGVRPSQPCQSGDGFSPKLTPFLLAVQLHRAEIARDLFVASTQETPMLYAQIPSLLVSMNSIDATCMHGTIAAHVLYETIEVVNQKCQDFHQQYGSLGMQHAICHSNEVVARALLWVWPSLVHQQIRESCDGTTRVFHPIHYATLVAAARPNRCSFRILQLLHDAGSSLSYRDHMGRTPLHIAACGQYPAALIWLLEAQGRKENAPSLIDQSDNFGRRAIHCVTHVDMLEELVSQGCDIDATDHSGRTLAHVTCIKGEHELLDRLIAMSAMLDRKDRLGNTPMHYAAASGFLDIAGMLLKARASNQVKNNIGQLPIDLARTIELRKVIRNTAPVAPLPRIPSNRPILQNLIDEISRLLASQSMPKRKVTVRDSQGCIFAPAHQRFRDISVVAVRCFQCNRIHDLMERCRRPPSSGSGDDDDYDGDFHDRKRYVGYALATRLAGSSRVVRGN